MRAAGILALLGAAAFAAMPPGDRWHQNPLGFEPVLLHTRNGFLLPLAAVGAGLLLTDRDASTGDWRLRSGLGLTEGYKHPRTILGLAHFGAEWNLRTWMAAGVDAELHAPRDAFNSTLGLAIRPFARFTPFQGERWAAWFEAGGGLVRYLDAFPAPTDRDARRGTLLNGTTQYGIGGEWRFAPRASAYAALKHVHVSNGNTLGAERNPSHDGNGVFAGLTWSPR